MLAQPIYAKYAASAAAPNPVWLENTAGAMVSSPAPTVQIKLGPLGLDNIFTSLLRPAYIHYTNEDALALHRIELRFETGS